MSLVGFNAINHPQQIAKRGPRPEIDDRATNPELFQALNRRFAFSLDVCAQQHNAKCERYIAPEQDGLEQPWTGERVWCNPPFSDIRPWVAKAWRECRGSAGAHIIVMLVPANRTEQAWWQELVEPYRIGAAGWRKSPLTHNSSFLDVEFLRGRPRFIHHDADRVRPNERPPFGCCLLIWRPYNYLTKTQAAVLRTTKEETDG